MAETDDDASTLDALACSLPRGAKLLGVGISTMKTLAGRADVATIKIGRRRLVLIASLRDYVSRLATK